MFRDKWATWRSQSGARWPGLHEFEIGCTLEHAGYALSWLVSLFGAVESSDRFSAIAFPDKGPGTEKITMAPDFSVGCLQFRSGMIGRLTSGLAAPRDRSLTIVGDRGSIVVADLWDNRSAVYLEELGKARKLDVATGDPPRRLAEGLSAVEARTGQAPALPRRQAQTPPARLSFADRFLPRDRGTGASDRSWQAAVLFRQPRAAHHRDRAGAEQRRRPAAALPRPKHVLILQDLPRLSGQHGCDDAQDRDAVRQRHDLAAVRAAPDGFHDGGRLELQAVARKWEASDLSTGQR